MEKHSALWAKGLEKALTKAGKPAVIWDGKEPPRPKDLNEIPILFLKRDSKLEFENSLLERFLTFELYLPTRSPTVSEFEEFEEEMDTFLSDFCAENSIGIRGYPSFEIAFYDKFYKFTFAITTVKLEEHYDLIAFED